VDITSKYGTVKIILLIHSSRKLLIQQLSKKMLLINVRYAKFQQCHLYIKCT